jgi:glutaredoxin 3
MWMPIPRRARLRALVGNQRLVPVLVEDGKVVQIGWQGHGCTIAD